MLFRSNIVKVYDHGVDGNCYFYAMEFLSGKSLRGVLNERGKVSPYEAAEYAREAADALAAAHERGTIHRDIKPSNLMLSENGQVKVVDFGLAFEKSGMTLTGTGLAPGTPAYMSPEQIESSGGHLDERTDIYSLGVTLFELLSGERPFEGVSHYEVMRAILFQPAPELTEIDSSIPRELSDIVRHAMAKHPDERYQTMREFAQDLDRFVEGTQKI